MKTSLWGVPLALCVLAGCAPAQHRHQQQALQASAGMVRQAPASGARRLVFDPAAYAACRAPQLHAASNARADAARIAKLKANARKVQTMLETYGLDFNGKYPVSFAGLRAEAQKRHYWTTLQNPLNPGAPAVVDSQTPLPGAVAYEFLGTAKAKYHIHAWGRGTAPVRERNGREFVLDGIY